ncbi:uncharacterized protein LOC135961041 isoform X2 [Calliphora vicina]
MSSDESTSTQHSIVSNQDGTKTQLKSHKAEQWEINLIGNFVLDLYHRSFINARDEWMVKKGYIRKEFSNFITAELSEKLKELNGTADIGTLLHRSGFILNTPRGSNCYKIKYSTLFEFRNNKLKELDNKKINSDVIERAQNIVTDPKSMLLNLAENNSNILLEDNLEIDENEMKIPLEYQGSAMQLCKENFFPTNMSCCICQEDFSTMDTYEEHIQKHGDESDFEYLTTMSKFDTPIFKMSYSLCKNSHYFCFEFETMLEHLIIDKIIVVQSRSLYYVHNLRVPYKLPKNGKDRFFVDSHLFTIHLEQPIVLICHMESSIETRIIEQHHFMRSEEFPKVNFCINPNRLPANKIFKSKFTLPDYFPPKEIQDALKDDFYYENLMKTSSEFRDYVRNGKKLQPHNLGASINILLQIEDMDNIRQYVNLTQKNIKLRSYGDEYSFQLKPKQRIFIENILSAFDEVVLTSRTDMFTKEEDILKLMLQNSDDIRRMKKTFVGQIQAVNTGRISFKCYQKINIQNAYTVICRPSRLTFRYQYRSLEMLPADMHFLKNFLFPSKLISRPLSTISLSLYNTNINGEQLQAVRNIAEGPRNDATYIIFGPPGTGKTTTLVEAILQLLKKPNTKILVTASSNSACDEVAIRLCKYLKDLDIARAMVRIYSRSSELRIETIDEELLENSNMYNGQFYPDIEILHEYRIVVCTLSVVAKLATGKFGRAAAGITLYTHLFIDEVAASMEAEALQGITSILTEKSCLIISGDHKQLGPVLQSKRAKELGLDASLMDRLLERDCYRVDIDTGNYDRTIQTRLVRNHRSHPAIVNLYSGLYYNHTLESFAKKDDVSLCEIWHKSRNKNYPIIFHAIYEPSRSDNQSHSLYNLHELHVVMDYVKDLMYFGINGKPVKESDIGIISPYKKQYKRIQEELNIRKWFSIETGSVETFQGKEKDIIIVSFVRSGTRNLGFLDSPRRLNVTISRPKSLLIMVGNPQTLSLNSDFDYIIKECQRNNTFVGSNGPTRGGDFKKQPTGNAFKSEDKQPTGNAVKSEEKLTNLNENMKALNIDNKDEEKNTETSGKNIKARRRRAFGRAGGNSKNRNEKTNWRSETNGVKKDADNKAENDEEDDDDDDDDEDDDDSVDNGTDKPSSSTSAKGNSQKAKNKRQLHNRAGAKGGKISKQYGKGKQKNVADTNNNKNLNKNKIDTIFNDLPKVPTTLAQTGAIFTNEQQLQHQQQKQYYQNLQRQQLQQQQQHYYQNPYSSMNNNLFNMAGAPPPLHPPFIGQQQQHFNSPAFNQPLNYTSPFQNQTHYNNANNGFQNINVPNNNAFSMNINKPAENNSNSKKKNEPSKSGKKQELKTNTNNNNTKSVNKINVTVGNTNKNNVSNAVNATKKSSRVAANIHGKGNNPNDKANVNKTNTGSSAVTNNSKMTTNKSGDIATSTKPQQRSTSEAINWRSKALPTTSSGNTTNSASVVKPINMSGNFGTPAKSQQGSISQASEAINCRSKATSSGNTITTTSSIHNVQKPISTPNIYPTIRKTTTTTSTLTGNRESSSVNSFVSSYNSNNVPTTSSRPMFSATTTTYNNSNASSSLDYNMGNSRNLSFSTTPTSTTQHYAPSAPYVDDYSRQPSFNRNFDSRANKQKKDSSCVIS